MSDYRDYFIDGPGIDRGGSDFCSVYPKRSLPKGRASLTVTMTKEQKNMYLALGGAPWFKKVLTDAIKLSAGKKA